MGYIKEPAGVDFFIKSEPLTDTARKEISDFIKKYKEKPKRKTTKSNQEKKVLSKTI